MEKGSGRSRPLPFLFLEAVGIQERPEVAGQPHVLARRALMIHWFRAQVDGVLAGRAQSEATRPPRLKRVSYRACSLGAPYGDRSAAEVRILF